MIDDNLCLQIYVSFMKNLLFRYRTLWYQICSICTYAYIHTRIREICKNCKKNANDRFCDFCWSGPMTCKGSRFYFHWNEYPFYLSFFFSRIIVTSKRVLDEVRVSVVPRSLTGWERQSRTKCRTEKDLKRISRSGRQVSSGYNASRNFLPEHLVTRLSESIA